MVTKSGEYVRVAKVDDIRKAGCLPAQADGHALALFYYDGHVYALEDRCPHMGFPLHRGTVKAGILTCHWHHARFDLSSGGTFDQWADEARSYPVQIRDGEVWVDHAQRADPRVHQSKRLRDGLERNIPLVIGKAVITLMSDNGDASEPFRSGLDFGVRFRQAGWGPGLTVLTCMMNLQPYLDPEDKPQALFHGLSAVANDCANAPPRFGLRPLPMATTDFPTLKRWFRQFVEVRDAEGAERCVVSAVQARAGPGLMADMLFAAATDHRYIQIGHVVDFTNKAFESLDHAGWDHAEPVLTSLVRGYANANRMEESNSWRHPADLVSILERSFEKLPEAMRTGSVYRGSWKGQAGLIPVLLGEDPQAVADSLLAAVREGCILEQLAATVAYAAALRVAKFHTSNEFSDWDTALHTFTYANAVHQALRRVESPELVRGVLDAAMSVYLDRFLNIPAAKLPESTDKSSNSDVILGRFPSILNLQQQVNEAGELVARYLHSNGDPDKLLATIGKMLLREDRDFHTIQMVEAAFRQHLLLRGTDAGLHVLVAAARYLAAHSPTVRSENQTYQIANRLSRGEKIFEG